MHDTHRSPNLPRLEAERGTNSASMAARFLTGLSCSAKRMAAACRPLHSASNQPAAQNLFRSVGSSVNAKQVHDHTNVPLRDYSGQNPDFYYNSSLEDATIESNRASRFSEQPKMPLRDYSGQNPDFYFNTSVEDATITSNQASRFGMSRMDEDL